MYCLRYSVLVGLSLFLTITNITAKLTQPHASETTWKGSYGEVCNKTSRCNSGSQLSCKSEFCQCRKPLKMVFDSVTNKCAVKMGESCNFDVEFEETEGYWYQPADCLYPALCSASGICSCPTGHYKKINAIEGNHKCLPIKSLGESCEISEECNKELNLACITGSCRCDPDTSIYNNVGFSVSLRSGSGIRIPNTNMVIPPSTCLGLVGSPCSYGKYCAKNAGCDELICKCSKGYVPTEDKLCAPGPGQNCSEVEECSGNLICTGSSLIRNQVSRGTPTSSLSQITQCQCPDNNDQEFDYDLKICRGYVGSSCDPKNILSCVDAAVCAKNYTIFQCQCSEGYVETPGRLCEIGYGSGCNYLNGNIVTNSTDKVCDQLAKLWCRRERCSCQNESDFYEEDRRQCFRMVGFTCKESSECVANAMCCRGKGQNRNLMGRCVCTKGFQVGGNHTCIPVN